MTIRPFDPDQLDAVNDLLKDARKALRLARRRDDDQGEARWLAEVERLKARRAGMKDARRRERRAEGRAVDQILGRAVASLVDEEKAKAYAQAEAADQISAVIRGTRTLDEAIDRALAGMAREADQIFDFTPIPVVGPFLEAFDDQIFRWAFPVVRKIVAEAFDKALKDAA